MFVSPYNESVTLRAYASFFEAGVTPAFLIVETLDGDPMRAPLGLQVWVSTEHGRVPPPEMAVGLLDSDGVVCRVGDLMPEDLSYRAMYEELGLRVVAHPDGTLEASWRFGEATLRKNSDTSKNKHATKHFHATEHPIVRSFEPGEDWRWCYVDEVLV